MIDFAGPHLSQACDTERRDGGVGQFTIIDSKSSATMADLLKVKSK